MTKWKQSIVVKLFLITSALLVLISSVIYLLFYFFLPSFYEDYKIDTLEEGISQLKQDIEGLSLSEAKLFINEFSEKTNTEVVVVNKEEQIVYLPAYLTQLLESPENNFSMIQPRFPPNFKGPGIGEENDQVHINSIQLDLVDGTYKAFLRTSLQPIDEVPKVIVDFLPYILIVIVLLTFSAAFIYSKITAKPLLELNRVAKKMARLDFSESTNVKGKDELGQLGVSLNQLSENLQQNITALQEANEQLQSDIEKERQIELARREFIAIISHELKSPITIVKGQLEAMIHQIGRFKDRDKYLKRSHDILEEMEELVRELLNISELEQPNYPLKRQAIPVDMLIYEILQSQEFFIQEKSLNISIEADEVTILADYQLFIKAVRNVIQNAIKYSPEKGEIKILLKKSSGLDLSVWNEASLIAEEQIQHIFKPFYRIEQSRNRATGGSGLGLYITKKIVDLHGFSCNFKNDGAGVSFHLHIDAQYIEDN